MDKRKTFFSVLVFAVLGLWFAQGALAGHSTTKPKPSGSLFGSELRWTARVSEVEMTFTVNGTVLGENGELAHLQKGDIVDIMQMTVTPVICRLFDDGVLKAEGTCNFELNSTGFKAGKCTKVSGENASRIPLSQICAKDFDGDVTDTIGSVTIASGFSGVEGFEVGTTFQIGATAG